MNPLETIWRQARGGGPTAHQAVEAAALGQGALPTARLDVDAQRMCQHSRKDLKPNCWSNLEGERGLQNGMAVVHVPFQEWFSTLCRMLLSYPWCLLGGISPDM